MLDKAKRQGRDKLTPAEDRKFTALIRDLRGIEEHIKHLAAEEQRKGADHPVLKRINTSEASASDYVVRWGDQAVQRLRRVMGGGENRAVVSASIDLPTLVEADVAAIPRPVRVVDLFSNRLAIDSNSFEFFRATARANNATVIADMADKPTSVNTITPIQDRARVIAHLSESAPQRLWDDHAALRDWLTAEMTEGVLDALEAQAISGSGTGENMTGLLTVTGTTAVAYDTSVVKTLRSALTAAQVAGIQPSGWVMHPADAAAVDLTRWDTAGGFLSGGYENDSRQGVSGSSDNVFGPTIPRVVSPSIPAGTALLGDFSKLRLYVKQDIRIDIDVSGAHFVNNTFVMRAEGRFGLGILRPASFFKIDLTP